MIQHIAIVFALSQVALLIVAMLSGGVRYSAERFLILLMLCVSSEMLGQLLPDFPGRWVLVSMYTGTAGVFWLLCLSIFDDHFRLRFWQLGLVACTIILPDIVKFNAHYTGEPTAGLLKYVFKDLPQFLELVLLVWAYGIMLHYWQVDLVSARRRIRLPLLLISGFFILFVIATRYVLRIYSPWMYDAQYIVLAGVLLIINVQMLPWRRSQLFGDGVIEVQQAEHKPEGELSEIEQLKVQLSRVMEEEKLYRQMGLTIADVAKAVQLPEYRLRQLINSEMGYRNFNDFLARYRIDEASQRLARADEKRLAVLTIAMDVGYKSISTFNKSFKEIHSITPTQYRKQQLAVQESK